MWFVPESFVEFYGASLRGSLFTGFLTLTGFLFSMKSFLLANLQKDIYGTEGYQQWIATARKYKPTLKATGSLRRLGRMLLVTILATFTASVCQFTVGLVDDRRAVTVCLVVAAIAIVAVARAIIILSIVVKDWMDYIDHEAAKVKPNNSAATGA